MSKTELVPAPATSGQPDGNGTGSSKEEEREIVVLEQTTLQVGDTTVRATRAVGLQVEEKTHEEIELVETEHGMVARKVTRRQFHVRHVMLTNLYIEAKATKDNPEDDDVEATCGEKCTDVCCQSTTCTFSDPFKRSGTRHIETTELLTDTLRRGRAKGWKMYYSAVFPLIRPAIRDAWVIAELVLVSIGLILSIATVSLDQNRAFNILHLVLIILSSVLALLDGILTLKECESCKICCKKTKIAPAKSNTDTEAADLEDNASSADSEGKCCKKNCCYSNCKNISDIARIVITEMLLYPLLICDIFEVITEKGYEGKTPGDRLGFTLFILSCISYILYNYLARLLVLAGMIRSVQEARTPGDELWTWQQGSSCDPSIKNSALAYQIYFFIHVFLQMLAQVLMFIAIGGKIRYDNRHFYSSLNTDESIYVSGHLWYMIVVGYFLPLMGFLTFFLATYHWTQEFPIGLCVDMISIWKMGNPDDIVYIDREHGVKESSVLQVINQFIRIEKLEREFLELRNTNCCDKFGYPFKAPVLVVISLVYIALHLGFMVCAAVAVNDMGVLMGQILNGGGWVFYYIVVVIISAIANVYMFAVAALWIGVVLLVITIIALVVAFFILLIMSICCLAVCAGVCDTDD